MKNIRIPTPTRKAQVDEQTSLREFCLQLSRALIIAGAIGSSSGVAAQMTCDGGYYDTPVLTPSCGLVSSSYSTVYSQQSAYVPQSSLGGSTPRTIKVAIHVWRKDDGSDNYQNDAATIAGLTGAVDDLNTDFWQYNDATSDPVGYPEVSDAMLRAELMGIFFHNSTTNYNRNCGEGAALSAAAIQAYPETRKWLNLHLINPNACGSSSGAANYPIYQYFQSTSQVATETGYPGVINTWVLAQHWAHEIGHNMDLRHPYTPGDEACQFSDSDFLWDVFGSAQQPWCTSPPAGCDVCYHDGWWTCDPYAVGNSCTNNIMGATDDAGHFSRLQIGRNHRALALSGVRQFAWGFDSAPHSVTADEEWDFNIKFYSDIVVEPGATLTITCTVEMVPEARIIVKPGGKLVVDGGLITAAQHSDDFWRGIEVWGTANQWQYDNAQYQGHLVLKNGARIEHAREGIQTMNPDDWTTMGGIVEAYGTATEPVVFYNCRRAASFIMYENVNQNTGVHYANRSYFKYCDFIVDDDYRGADDFYAHVSLWRVDGIKFLACNFKNLRSTPGITSESAKLGQGILALDARFKVQGICQQVMPPGQTCPPATWTPSTFVGLDHGIEARNSSTAYNFTVDRCTFTNNVCGVYANGVTGFAVRWCEFELGNREVALTGDDIALDDMHRAIYSTNGYGFQIDDNYMSLATNPTAQCEGIVIGYTRDHNDIAFHNVATGMDAAFVGEGICADPANKTFIGLQYICNENLGNGFNIWNRKIGQADPNELQHHTMRLRQGALDRPAANTFDRDDVNLPVESDLHSNTNQNTVFYFYHSPGNGYDPLDIDAVYFPKTLATTVPDQVCGQKWFNGPVIGNDPNGASPAMIGLLNGHLSTNKLAYGNTRYLYDQLIDGGSTDEVVQEIMSTWPQDAWELRDYLLDLSPNLSTGALKEMVEKGIMPPAMIAEVCIANPDATRQDGFLVWLQEESGYPLPEYLADAIVASWDQQGYRFNMETTMGEQHARMTLAANLLVDVWQRDTLDQSDSLRAVWQRVRTAAARYAEALVLMQLGDYAMASTVVESIPIERELEPEEEEERQRMLSLIAFLQGVRATGRNEAQLNTGELDALEQIIDSKYDRAATWAQNLLCFGYGRCRAPLSGSDGVDPKSLRPASSSSEQARDPGLSVFPNPASTFCTLRYRLPETRSEGAIVVQDAMGRVVFSQGVSPQSGDLLWDVRGRTSGVYSVELRNGSAVVATERLVLKP